MLLINPVELLFVLLGLAFAAPWALLAVRSGGSRLLVAVTTIALSIGALTLWMLALALADALTPAGIALGMLAGFGVGAALVWGTGWRPALDRSPREALAAAWARAHASPLAAAAVLVIVAMLALIAFNLLYWPFNTDDAVSIYALHSRTIYETRVMPTGEGLYEAYPMLLPLSYVYSYIVAGEIAEYLARVFVVALSVGAFGATAALGRTLYDGRTGLLAALLLALTPTYVRWSATGYTDVPAGFFAALSALFAWRLLQDGAGRDALLAGMMAGLAAWTKNSALAFALSLGAVIVYGMMPRLEGARLTMRHVMLAGAGGLLTAGPWYAHNLAAFGHAIPSTLWLDRAQPTLENLVPFLVHARVEQFFLPGIAFTFGLVVIGWEALRLPGPARDSARVLIAYGVPFAAAWWRLASYETRFLMTIVPLLAVMGAHGLIQLGAGFRWRPDARARRAVVAVAIVALVALALPAARKAVLFKDELLRDPLMDDAARHRQTVGPVYDVAQFLNAIPAEGMILSDNYMLPFYIENARVAVGGLPYRSVLAQYSYLVLSPGSPLPAAMAYDDVELLTALDGFRVYRVTYTPGRMP